MSDPTRLPDSNAEPSTDADESRPLSDLRRALGRPCAGCAGRCSAFEVVWSVALGFREAPRCLPCLGRGLGRDEGELRAQVTDYVHRRDCFRRAWDEAVRLEGTEPPATGETAPVHVADGGVAATETPSEPELNWDAGDMACGELVLALRVRLGSFAPGSLIRVRATDPAAPEDIPAWCRLTGHTLASADHPFYLIRRKGA
jgi:tRNA 2-thiouridine synthesizing protein A